jgi:hypothetical protein
MLSANLGHFTDRLGITWASFNRPPDTPAEAERWYQELDGYDVERLNLICAKLPSAAAIFAALGLGRFFPADLAARFRTFVPKRQKRPVPYFERPWCCFENSFRLAQARGLLYIEGLAVNPSFVQVHAWNSRDGSDVLDLTWPRQDLNSYYGVALDPAEVEREVGAPGGLIVRHLKAAGIDLYPG